MKTPEKKQKNPRPTVSEKNSSGNPGHDQTGIRGSCGRDIVREKEVFRH